MDNVKSKDIYGISAQIIVLYSQAQNLRRTLVVCKKLHMTSRHITRYALYECKYIKYIPGQ